ncbi:MAG: L-fucose/L-arabinose isomerase family protein [Anaerolineae bacterium]|nr:L-fucose/L-arabinose isomerase family protein [Anaerolineae bacterium]
MLQIQRRKPLTAKAGVLGVGHHTYWEQFAGLYEKLEEKLSHLIAKLENFGVAVTAFGIADKAQHAYALIPQIKRADVDVLFVDMLTYATSSVTGAIFREIDVPIVLVALQPLPAMDYEHGSTFMQLLNDDICSLPEFTGVAVRMGRKPPPCIIGMLHNDPQADAELSEWCAVARVLHDLRRARLGHMGHVLEAMLDMHTDPTALTAAFGAHVVQCEPEQLLKHYQDIEDARIAQKEQEILAFFDTPDPISDPVTMKLTPQDLRTAARAAVALDRFIEEQSLDGLAYYYEGSAGTPTRELMTNLIVGNSLLTGAGFPMCGEFDIKTCVAMMIMDRLEMGGSFAEFHPVDFERDSVLVGHDGPHHINIADRKPVLRSLLKYHGKPGSGAGVEFNIKEGPITLLSVSVNARGDFKFVLAEGESLRGPIPPTGNTNTHGKFKPDARTFLKRWCAEGPTHHFALGVGHRAVTIKQLAEILNIEAVIVT